MKKETLRCLLIVVFLGVLVLGLKAETSVTKCKDVVEGYMEFLGGTTWYRMAGIHAKRIPLIVLHGGPGVNSWYLESLEKLGNDRPVILYDQRGCGKSGPLPPDCWNMGFYVEELKQIIQYFGFKRYHIMGHSWGTMIATDFALTQPEGLVSLIMSSPAISAPLWLEDQRELLKQLPEDVQNVIYWHEENQIYDTPEYAEAMNIYYHNFVCRLDPWPELLDQSLGALNYDIYFAMWGPSEFTCTGPLQYYDRSNMLYQIEVPTLFTCGKYDEATPRTVEYYMNQMPHSRLKVFQKSSHMAMMEQPKCFINYIRQFLKQMDKGKY